MSESPDGFEEHEHLQRRLDRSVIAGPLLEQVSASQQAPGTPDTSSHAGFGS